MDTKARKLIQQDLSKTYLVEAGAGTGKTTLLVSRILHILETGAATLPQIVAITFTEKSAEELKLRIHKQIETSLQKNNNSKVKHRLKQAFFQINRAPIGTIHSFCASILREYPIEAGIDPGFEVADKTFFSSFLQNVWQRWLTREIANRNNCLQELLELGIQFSQIQKMTAALYLYRDVIKLPFLPSLRSVNCQEFRNQANIYFQKLEELSQHCSNKEDKGFINIKNMGKQWQFLNSLPDKKLMRYLIHGIKIPIEGNRKNWSPPHVLKEIKEIFRQLREIFHQTHSVLVHNLTQEVACWLTGFLVYAKREKRESALLDFEDLLILTRNLLLEKKKIRSKCQEKFRYILVDEFQDTDPLQVEILWSLAENGIPKDSWQQMELLPGKLFIVGDPKQSIYRFRRADIEIYETVKEMLGKPACLSITRNFRSSAGIIEYCNQVFSKLIQKPLDGRYQPHYIALEAHRKKQGGEIIWLLPDAEAPEPTTQTDIAYHEALAIVSAIEKFIEEKKQIEDNGLLRVCKYDDMAILLRRFTYIETFEQVFSQASIPIKVVGGKSFYHKLEISSLLSLLHCLMNPCDNVSLVAVLRSPLFSVSDEEIFSHCHHYQSLDYTKEKGKGKIENIFKLLENLHSMIGRVKVAKLLQKIFESTAMLLTFGALKRGEERVANLTKILHLAHSQSGPEAFNFCKFIHWFENLEILEHSGKALENEDHIQIFSIHRSKGLEFPIVFLGDLGARPGSLSDILINRESQQPALRLSGRSHIRTWDYKEIAEKEQKRLEAEEKRLLYVAMTRARDYLCIPTAAKSAKGLLKFLQADMQVEQGDCVLSKKALQVDLSGPLKIKNLEISQDSIWKKERDSWHQQFLTSRKRWKSNRHKENCARQSKLSLDQKNTDFIMATKDALLYLAPLIKKDIFLDVELKFLLKHLAFTNFLTLEMVAKVHQTIEKIIVSEVFLRMSNAKQIYRQLPFTYQEDNIIIEGNVDFGFVESENIVAVVLEEKHSKTIEEYELQGALWALAFSKMKINIQEIVFLFLETSEHKNIFIDEALLTKAQMYCDHDFKASTRDLI